MGFLSASLFVEDSPKDWLLPFFGWLPPEKEEVPPHDLRLAARSLRMTSPSRPAALATGHHLGSRWRQLAAFVGLDRVLEGDAFFLTWRGFSRIVLFFWGVHVLRWQNGVLLVSGQM